MGVMGRGKEDDLLLDESLLCAKPCADSLHLPSSFLLAALFGRSYCVSSVLKDARGSEHSLGRGSFRPWAVRLHGSVSPPEHQLTRLPRPILYDALFLRDASMSYSICSFPTIAVHGELLSLV